MLVHVFSILVLASISSHSSEGRIDLNKIWALEMPNTKNVRELQKIPAGLPNDVLLQRSYVRQIEKALSHKNLPPYGEQPRQAIVVKGEGLDALREAARVLTEMAEKGNKKEPELIQPVNTNLSLVFYSYSSAHYVSITGVEVKKSTITVKYRFISHTTTNMSTHFALIPLGKLPKGPKPVKIVQEATLNEDNKPATLLRGARRYVSDSFTFRIE